MKGIILAGGSGSRLAPLTNIISKQLLPVYDKPMICYPLATLLHINIKDILIISTPQDTPNIERYLGDGSSYGIKLSYAVQEDPKGIAEAFVIGEKFIGSDPVCLILGDNIFYGSEVSSIKNESLSEEYAKIKSGEVGAYIFAYNVSDPQRYGVVELDANEEKAISLEEKPMNPKSNLAVTGLYLYNNDVVEIAKNLKPSARGELEITDVNIEYLKKNKLGVVKFRRGFAWLDAGTPDSLIDSACFIQTIEKRQGLKIACVEEIAYRKGYIDDTQMSDLISTYKEGSAYRKYLETVLK